MTSEEETRLLGVSLDTNLKSTTHINSICEKVVALYIQTVILQTRERDSVKGENIHTPVLPPISSFHLIAQPSFKENQVISDENYTTLCPSLKSLREKLLITGLRN